MSLLVGLPLKLFRILFLLLRVAWPVLLALLVWLLLRRRGKVSVTAHPKEKKPTFDGPVYTVDYEEVDETTDEEG
ncbi:MAG: hypothetical protein E7443_01880 [Ruminococcaceae bacterium]|nr:hypothetical protein [Oscillospiraceae bacterium]